MKKQFILLVLVGSILISCDEARVTPTPDDPDVDQFDPKDDFFPMTENKQWEYVHTYLDEDSSLTFSEILTLKIDEDTVIDDKTYKQFVDEKGIVVKVARREGSQYFGRNHELYGGFSHEYMFLDTAVEIGGSWSYLKNEGNTKTEYIVKELHDLYTVSGVEFKNVLEIETNYYELKDDEFIFTLSSKHFYAKGLGEVYSFYPGIPFGGFTYHHVVISGYVSN